MAQIKEDDMECPLLLTQRVIFGKWKPSILWFLGKTEAMRFGEIKKAFEDPILTQKMLTQHLRELEEDGLVLRKAYNEMPLRVEYSLTDIGRRFIPILDSMEAWGMEYIESITKPSLHNSDYDTSSAELPHNSDPLS